MSEVTQKTVEVRQARQWEVGGFTGAKINQLNNQMSEMKKVFRTKNSNMDLETALPSIVALQHKIWGIVDEAIGCPVINYRLDCEKFEQTRHVLVTESLEAVMAKKEGGMHKKIDGDAAAKIYDLSKQRNAINRQIKEMKADCDAMLAQSWKLIYQALEIDEANRGTLSFDETLYTDLRTIEVYEKEDSGFGGIMGSLLRGMI